TGDASARGFDARDGRAPGEADVPFLLAPGRQVAGELAGIAGLVHGREDGAGKPVLRRGEGRLRFGQTVAIEDLDAEAVVGQQAHVLHAVVQALLRAEEIEDAAIAAVEVAPRALAEARAALARV